MLTLQIITKTIDFNKTYTSLKNKNADCFQLTIENRLTKWYEQNMVKFKQGFKCRCYRFLNPSLTHCAPNGNETLSK